MGGSYIYAANPSYISRRTSSLPPTIPLPDVPLSPPPDVPATYDVVEYEEIHEYQQILEGNEVSEEDEASGDSHGQLPMEDNP